MTTQKQRSFLGSYSVASPLAGLLVFALAAPGCAANPPKELRDAHDAYRGAANGVAAETNPAQLHAAEQALKLADKTFEEEGASHRTRDRAYVAMRKAQLAETQARIMRSQSELQAMMKRSGAAQVAELEQTKGALVNAEQERKNAELKAAAATLELSRLANVKQDERGLVITLSGSVLFASSKAELLPAARRRLGEVADALNGSDRTAQIVVEGHTDSKGSDTYNLELSARRAEAVRSYLVSRGIDAGRIRAEGLGLTRPVADNTSAEGRANNRRVEIVVQPNTGNAAPARAGT
jgi:outer membrane protein OmpA-like peptidoglycan-associated protein